MMQQSSFTGGLKQQTSTIMHNSSESLFANRNGKKGNKEPLIDAKTNEIDSVSHLDGDLTPQNLKYQSGGLENSSLLLRSQNNQLGGSNITETGDKDGKSQMGDSIMRGGKTLQSSRTDLTKELLNNETSTIKGKNRNVNQSNNQTHTNNNNLIVTASENMQGKIEGVSVSRASANNKSIGQVLSKVVRLMPKEPVIKTKQKMQNDQSISSSARRKATLLDNSSADDYNQKNQEQVQLKTDNSRINTTEQSELDELTMNKRINRYHDE